MIDIINLRECPGIAPYSIITRGCIAPDAGLCQHPDIKISCWYGTVPVFSQMNQWLSIKWRGCISLFGLGMFQL